MTSAIQIVNSEHDDIQATRFLPLLDRNFGFEAYNNPSPTTVQNTDGYVTVSFGSTKSFHPSEMFTFDSGEISILYPGVYTIFSRLNAGGASASNLPVTALLDLSLAEGSYSEVQGSRAYAPAPIAGFNNLIVSATIKIVAGELPAKVRVRFAVESSGSISLSTHRAFSAICLYASMPTIEE